MCTALWSAADGSLCTGAFALPHAVTPASSAAPSRISGVRMVVSFDRLGSRSGSHTSGGEHRFRSGLIPVRVNRAGPRPVWTVACRADPYGTSVARGHEGCELHSL